MSVALDHLFKWVDAGTVPPRAPRILLDRDQFNDGSMMALDEHGNPRGGIQDDLRGCADGEVRDSTGGDQRRSFPTPRRTSRRADRTPPI